MIRSPTTFNGQAGMFKERYRNNLGVRHSNLQPNCTALPCCQIYSFTWGDLQPDCLADRPVTGPRQST
eukprot:498900-Pelagomonas_calceolata.AAC.1